MKNTLIVIVGPTGVGKSELCLTIARHLNVPIINADSRQIFSELPIGTAAPTPEQQQRAHHYFVGNHSLDDYYSASVDEKGIDDIPTVNNDIRTMMKHRLATEGLEALVNELHELDPEHWAVVDKNNPRRVVHALEICHQTGRTYTSFRTNTVKQRPFNILKIGLNRDRETMYQRINQRVLDMMDAGLEQEARSVYHKRECNSLNTVGYKEMFAYFDGSIDRNEAVRQIQSNTRRYMRKQLTWFKKDDTIRWFSPDNIEEIIKYIDKSL